MTTAAPDGSSEIVRLVGKALGDSPCAALAMFPYHDNVGDSAIWAATVAVLARLKVNLRYACSHVTYHPQHLRKCHPEGPILILGGGNFGDVYPAEDTLRRRIINDFADRQVIQLPQSIWFKTEHGLDEMKSLVAKHRDFVLLVRDKPSLRLAREHFDCRTELCPDMALMLRDSACGQAGRKDLATHDILCLLRRDGERREACGCRPEFPEGISVLTEDWKCEQASYRSTWTAYDQAAWLSANATLLAATKKHGQRIPMGWVISAKNRIARIRTVRGIRQLQTGRVIVTDRLHAAILGRAAGRRVFLLDNSYGKNRNVYEAWFRQIPEVSFAEDVDEACVSAVSFVNSNCGV